ncbi:hypothetical protein [Nonomuraea sp. NPDC049709]|uniref:hypothetical protein n=1 Tax=Nonomuraea sp. NPDC049709 TaxID=3154736 RepID=UPI00341B72B7
MTRQSSRPESLRPLRNVTYGRIVFTSRAMPAIRLVPHAMDGDNLLADLPGDNPGELARARRIPPPRPGRSIRLVARTHPELVTGSRTTAP